VSGTGAGRFGGPYNAGRAAKFGSCSISGLDFEPPLETITGSQFLGPGLVSGLGLILGSAGVALTDTVDPFTRSSQLPSGSQARGPDTTQLKR
jgi:hypothetical protein